MINLANRPRMLLNNVDILCMLFFSLLSTDYGRKSPGVIRIPLTQNPNKTYFIIVAVIMGAQCAPILSPYTHSYSSFPLCVFCFYSSSFDAPAGSFSALPQVPVSSAGAPPLPPTLAQCVWAARNARVPRSLQPVPCRLFLKVGRWLSRTQAQASAEAPPSADRGFRFAF